MKKALAFFTASILTVASFSVLPVNATETFTLGDVDMDGYITGHDAALVSRHLIHGDNNLTNEQLKLADYNQDGTVDQTDVELIGENMVYKLGDVNLDGQVDLDDGFDIIAQYSSNAAGKTTDTSFTKLQINLSDMDGTQNAVPTLDNAFECISYYSFCAAGAYEEFHQTYGKGIFMLVNGQKCAYYSLKEMVQTPDFELGTVTFEEDGSISYKY